MFNFGFFELILLFIIVVIFVGPEQLPVVAKNILKLLNEWKQVTDKVKGPLNTMQEEISNSIKDSREILFKEVEDVEELVNSKGLEDIKELGDIKELENIKDTAQVDKK
ncbi:MAG: hypothetical protein HAW63_00415 [Bdellovibrionaceae bacterium]|nr:hypothetical protein [Pseudobdellovibrionaceae bacterium]